ncbi:hypothetical protein IFM89_001576 [Coptis chinensis]|uniref:J domain-containing protein n=1 Tax=Coptis chinensis TaxID=261450 RepID=A0A835I2F6_9MAGN|nr:hypothetical protein IFM89_001576 [Coptis chinensis]
MDMSLSSRFNGSKLLIHPSHQSQSILESRKSITVSCRATMLAREKHSTNYYEVLSLHADQNVSVSEIKKAYRAKALQYHPDVCHTSGRDESVRMFVEVHKAYQTLSDPITRKKYDIELISLSKYETAHNLKARDGVSMGGWEDQLYELKRSGIDWTSCKFARVQIIMQKWHSLFVESFTHDYYIASSFQADDHHSSFQAENHMDEGVTGKPVISGISIKKDHQAGTLFAICKVGGGLWSSWRAMKVYDQAAKTVPDNEKMSMYEIYIARAAEIFGVPKTREIYEQAIESGLPDKDVKVMCMKYAKLEKSLGEIDRARAIYNFSPQYL